jgi:hypothetical protein
VLNSPVWRGRPLIAFCLGLLTGGALMSLALLVVGSLVRLALPLGVRVAVVGLLGVAVVLRELGVLRFPVPENRRLVPESVLRLGRFFGPYQFGLEMGTGARTYLPTGLPHAVALAVALLAGVWPALLAGLGFGIGRAAMIVANLRYTDDNAWDGQWVAHHRRITALLALSYAATFGAVVVTAAVS